MDRRTFMKALGISSCALFVPAGQPWAIAQEESPPGGLDPSEVVWKKAPCRYCGTGCGVEVGIHGGRAVAVRGDEQAPVNRGLLCVKGYHLPAMLYGSDRLKHPMRRKSSGAMEKISWDDALDLVAGKFGAALKENGPNGIAMYGSGQWTIHDGYAALKWVKGGMRSNNIDPNARLCMASAVMGFVTQFQSDEPMGCYDDFEAGDDFVLWGNNMAECHPVLFSRMLARKRASKSARIIDIATRRTPTTNFADEYVEFKPGTDLALANGILHLLAKSGRFDQAFIKENLIFKRGIEDLEAIGYGCWGEDGTSAKRGVPAQRYGFKDKGRDSSMEEMIEFLAEYTPEQVSKISGVPVEQIGMLADLYGDSKRGTVSLWVMGVNQHVRGTWMNNLLTNIHLLTGKISKPGSNPFSLTGQPSACGTVREVGTLSNRLPADMVVMNPEHRAKTEKIWGLPAGTINPTPGHHTMDMFRAWDRGDTRAMWIQVTNPATSIPNWNRYERQPGDGRFLVVSDIYPTPTTAMADLILPSAAWIERESCFGNSERRTQHWERMIEPVGEARADALQIIQVAKRMGMGNLFPWPEDAYEEPMFEEYRKFTLGTGKDLASYAELRKARGLKWPVVDGKETGYRYAAGFDPYVKKAEGVHFYKAKGYGEKAAVWIRPYHPSAESPDEEYPFWLCTGRVLEHWHTGSMTRRVGTLHRAVPEAYVEMNPADAARLGIGDGDLIKVSSRRGICELPAQVNGRGTPPPGSVFVPFFDESKVINRVTLDAMDNISKEPDYKKCAVKLEKL